MRGLLKILALLVVGAAPINASEPPKPLIFLASQSGKQTLDSARAGAIRLPVP